MTKLAKVMGIRSDEGFDGHHTHNHAESHSYTTMVVEPHQFGPSSVADYSETEVGAHNDVDDADEDLLCSGFERVTDPDDAN